MDAGAKAYGHRHRFFAATGHHRCDIACLHSWLRLGVPIVVLLIVV
jgi:hypothetical protein